MYAGSLANIFTIVIFKIIVLFNYCLLKPSTNIVLYKYKSVRLCFLRFIKIIEVDDIFKNTINDFNIPAFIKFHINQILIIVHSKSIKTVYGDINLLVLLKKTCNSYSQFCTGTYCIFN